MRLISCYIENFGGLQKFSYEFNEGLNIILEENGWGKSTLAAFLKAMFYGLERTTKRSLDENERKKYEPWNGGAYGGNLVFEADGDQYRIERFFGGKDKEDSFALYDVRTGLESGAYTEQIGEELFGIDRVAFEQSIFMKQGMYAVSMTDSVTTKLSGLMASGDDVDCYEKACARIDAEMKIYKKIGNKGKIPELTEEIAALNRRISEGRQIGASIAEWKEKEKKYRQELETAFITKEELKKQMLLAGEQAGLVEKQKSYALLLEEKEKLEKNLEVLDRFFQNGVPGDEELEQYRKKMFLYKHDEKTVFAEEKSFRYPGLVSLLKQNPMTEEELDACEQKWSEVKEKENLLEKKEIQLRAMQEREEEQDARMQERIDSVKVKQRLAIISAVIMAVAAVALYFTVGSLYALIGAVLFVIALVFIIVLGMNCRRLEANVGSENEELLQMEEEWEELKQSVTHMKKSVRMYLQSFAVSSEEEIPSCINKLRITLLEVKAEEESRHKQQTEAEKRSREKETLREELILFLRRFYPDVREVEEYYLKEIEQKRNEYGNISNRYEAKKAQLAGMEKVEEILPEQLLSIEELQGQERVLEQQIREQENRLRQVRQTLIQYGEAVEECEKLEMEKHDAEELLAEYAGRYKLLEKTLKYLKTAQNEFSSRYLKKMNEGFAKYAVLFREGAFEQSALDIKLSVKSEEGGVKRDIGYYSVGLRETMELCTRLALIDALYEKEEPFVVLDDPFVNLDEKSLDGAKKVLTQVAEQFQLIYFTCHPSRQ